jgi:hypothetical protein
MANLKEDLLLATLFGAPYIAPFAVPYYIATGKSPTVRQLAFTIWSGIAWGLATKGGSLFLNYHPEYGSAKHAARLTSRVVQLKLAYEGISELTNPSRYQQQDGTQSPVILHRGRFHKNPYHPSNMPL